jgi:hypothetical protein
MLWRDTVNQTHIYSILVGWKGESLMRSAIRAINAGDLTSPALVARAMIEHVAAAYSTVVKIFPVFEKVAPYTKPVRIPEEQMLKLETVLVRAMWGTRIGTGKLSDKTPLWHTSPYHGSTIQATNIMTSLQMLSATPDGMNNDVLKVYEWLSDVVHPATQGFRMFWNEEATIAEGHTRYRIMRGGGAEAAFIQFIVLWAVGYSSVGLTNLLRRINSSVGLMHKHLDIAYREF